MKWSAFSKAIEDLRSETIAPQFRETNHLIARLIETGQRFYFPDGSNIVEGKRHSDLFDLYRLPFENITILHSALVDGVMCPAITVAQDYSNCPDLPIENAWCSVTSVVLHPINNIWCNLATVMIAKREMKPGEWGLGLAGADEPITRALVSQLGGERLEKEMAWDVVVVTNLCALLGMKNIETQRVAAPTSINAKRLRKGKALLLDYHVLKVDGEAWTSEEEGSAGIGSGSRSHLRRGHIRRLADGRRIWVRAAFVHGRIDGFVAKDYEVDTSTEVHHAH